MITIRNSFSEILPLPNGRWKLATAVGAGFKMPIVDAASKLDGVRKSHRPRHVVRIVRTTGDTRPDSCRGAIFVLVEHAPLFCPRCQSQGLTEE